MFSSSLLSKNDVEDMDDVMSSKAGEKENESMSLLMGTYDGEDSKSS
jgi:hypothetical protein